MICSVPSVLIFKVPMASSVILRSSFGRSHGPARRRPSAASVGFSRTLKLRIAPWRLPFFRHVGDPGTDRVFRAAHDERLAVEREFADGVFLEAEQREHLLRAASADQRP